LLFLFKGLAVADLRSLSDAATFFAVSQPTLRRWLDAGCPVAEKGSNGVAYKLDLHAVAAWRRGQQDAEDEAERARAERDAQLRLELLGPEALTVEADGATLTPKQRADALAAEVARTKLAQLRRELVSAPDLALLLSDVMATLKTRLRQIPDVVAPDLGLTTAQSDRLGELVAVALNDAVDAVFKQVLINYDPESPPS
jgi:phage terminase Nu1 subunit (DNA packaging protein)